MPSLNRIFFSVITVDRLLGIKFPLGDQRLDMQDSRITLLVILIVWTVVVLLSSLPLSSLSYFDNFYGRSGVCLALHITSDKPNGWEYSVFIFLGKTLLLPVKLVHDIIMKFFLKVYVMCH